LGRFGFGYLPLPCLLIPAASIAAGHETGPAHRAHRAFYGHVKESIRKHWSTYWYWSGLGERIGYSALSEIRRFRLSRSRRRQPTPLELVDKNDVRDDLLPVVLDRRQAPPVPHLRLRRRCRWFNIFVDFTNRFVWYRCRWVRIWGSRPSRRPAPVLACRYTPGCSSVCHFEQ
jgi:hypothetical protein